jgi:hypothetical protein
LWFEGKIIDELHKELMIFFIPIRFSRNKYGINSDRE